MVYDNPILFYIGMSYTVGKLLNPAFCLTYWDLRTSHVLSPGVPEKGYKIRAKVHGKGGILLTSRLAYAPLLDLTAVAGE